MTDGAPCTKSTAVFVAAALSTATTPDLSSGASNPNRLSTVRVHILALPLPLEGKGKLTVLRPCDAGTHQVCQSGQGNVCLGCTFEYRRQLTSD